MTMHRFVDWKAKFPGGDGETNEKALVRLMSEMDLHPGYLNELAVVFQSSRNSINQKICDLRRAGLVDRWALKRDSTVETKIVRTPDKKMVDSASPKEWLELLMEGTRLINKCDKRQEEVHPSVDTNGWIGLVVGGDWHIEHYRTDVAEVINSLTLIGKEPNLYFGFNGDSVDVINLRFMELENEIVSIPLRRLYDVVKYLFSLVPNTLFVVMGCHYNWVRTRARYDILEAVQSSIMGYYLGFGGTVNFHVGNSTYRIAALHKYAQESQTNPFHPCAKYLLNMDMSADVVCLAHRHDIVGISHTHVQGVPRIFMRSGSAQYRTEYAWKEGFRGAINRYPMVLLSGSEKRMIPVNNFKEGIPILREMNRSKKFARDVLKFGVQAVVSR